MAKFGQSAFGIGKFSFNNVIITDNAIGTDVISILKKKSLKGRITTLSTNRNKTIFQTSEKITIV